MKTEADMKEEESKDNKDNKDDQATLTRRAFLNKLSLGIGGVGALIVAVPIVGFLFAPLLKRPPDTWRAVGLVDTFKVGETVEVKFQDASPLPWAGVAALTAAWLRRDSEQKFIAYSVNCTHLGCPVNWLPSANLFLCPCHGGVYYSNGEVAAGPPPKPLTQYPVRVNNGQVEILASPVPIT